MTRVNLDLPEEVFSARRLPPNDSKCSAWTYGHNYRTKPCWLKSKTPAANANTNTTSGVVSRSPASPVVN